ncbi:hypothetical protein BCR34DRAFT_271113 [Clohesyomyces aquaticus]|uniref:Uncharacterized protein n=1 Tax=Clohesyomyces aquaticus TaxID=1231657 RepID=A0A1Y1Y1U7_9PLEO|nr:hypothetical protein BCR34DRAFT_271113 [Clohesyomyces aquaticus]
MSNWQYTQSGATSMRETTKAQTRDLLKAKNNGLPSMEGPCTWRRYSSNWKPEDARFDEPSDPAAATGLSNPTLSLVLERQSPGEPDHWSLFIARGSSANEPGDVYMVTGDAENMHFVHKPNVKHLLSEGYKTAYELCTALSKEAELWVKQGAESETPPS